MRTPRRHEHTPPAGPGATEPRAPHRPRAARRARGGALFASALVLVTAATGLSAQAVPALPVTALPESARHEAAPPETAQQVADQSEIGRATTTAVQDQAQAADLTNPIRSNGADPWLEYWDGYYYLSTTTWDSTVIMRRATTLAGLKTAPDTVVWNDAGVANRCCSHWAPEFHRIGGTWYLMYTSGNSQTNLDGQKLRVLRSTGPTPMGPYEFMGTPLPNQWNIDGTYLEHDGRLYLVWSEWNGPNQTVRIARMSNPWTVATNGYTIAQPSHAWETIGSRVNEAPAVLQRNGRTFMTYSASSCNTPDYKLGLLTLTGSDPLRAASWTKSSQPVLQRGNGVYGPGHNGFFTSPDGTEDWLVYHGNTTASQGCGNTRQTRVQRITWNSDGTPRFGTPVPSGQVMTPPSGE
ncbi:glycoside hydrolase family 43 protein [Promicromonospora iranensis]|uniref:GH43 family beta-xylosidase n=1 Tax=Promicromonospora iranensis TaxID=1105144 RepID=A0ABU2CGS8_9MICO|nr:glycoside hydrolase family 43 protein [Promicromonospora iranensis]MDR7380543.1 GH43 family beta-xylosidase [Promicromonospora iranensis]